MHEGPPGDVDGGTVTKTTAGSVDEVVDRLVALVDARDMTVFAVIDHAGEARRHGLELRDTKVVIFGSPIAGTPVMAAWPLTALDLPLRVLVWDDDGQTRVSYTDPAALASAAPPVGRPGGPHRRDRTSHRRTRRLTVVAIDGSPGASRHTGSDHPRGAASP